MKRKFLPLLFAAFAVGCSMRSYAQCNVSILGDTLVCEGDSPTLTAFATGPGMQMDASNTAGNNHRGNMFDIVATNSVTILSFDASPMGNTTIEVYYKVGTWNGFANTPSAWTYIGSAPVNYTGGFSPVAVPVNVTIPAGQTYAFYVTSNTSSVSLNYSNGTNVGNVYSSDANISFLEGGGMEYPFTQNTGAVYQPRVWNGRIHYSLANIPGTTYTWGGGENSVTINPTINNDSQFNVSVSVPGCPTSVDTMDVIVSTATISAGSDTTLCEGATLVLAGSYGTNYTWNNGISDGVPFVTGPTANYVLNALNVDGCPMADSITVSTAPMPNLNAGSDVDICAGYPVTLNAQGAPTLMWDNGISNNVPFVPTSSGDYTVIGMSNANCSDTDMVHVEIIPTPTVTGINDINVCPGTQIALFAFGTPSITWNNGVQTGVVFTAVSGEYIATGTGDNGCTDVDTVVVTVYDVDVDVTINSNVLTATQTNATYQWYNCPGMTEIAGATGASFTAVEQGNYAVVVTDSQHGCEVTSECIDIFFTGVEEQSFASDLSIYPVPTEGLVTIVSKGSSVTRMQLIDMTGRVLMDENMNTTQANVDLTNYASGQFFVRVYRNGAAEMVKVVKK